MTDFGAIVLSDLPNDRPCLRLNSLLRGAAALHGSKARGPNALYGSAYFSIVVRYVAVSRRYTGDGTRKCTVDYSREQYTQSYEAGFTALTHLVSNVRTTGRDGT